MIKTYQLLLAASLLFIACDKDKKVEEKETTANEFPFFIPAEKPNRPLSAAVERNYDAYSSIRPEQNELYTQFKYTKLEGFD